MEDQNDEKYLEDRLQSEKVKVPPLSEIYQKKLTQKILKASSQLSDKEKTNAIFSYRYLLVAALLLLSIGIGSITLRQPKETSKETTKETPKNMPKNMPKIVTAVPKMTNEEAVKVMIEKLNPDLIGVYANNLLKVDANLVDQYHSEFQALSMLSNRIVTSFYDDFKPVKRTEHN